jgi:hypothetical protein
MKNVFWVSFDSTLWFSMMPRQRVHFSDGRGDSNRLIKFELRIVSRSSLAHGWNSCEQRRVGTCKAARVRGPFSSMPASVEERH